MTIPEMHVDIEPTRSGTYSVVLTSNGTHHYRERQEALTLWGARRVARAMLRQERKYWTTGSEKVQP